MKELKEKWSQQEPAVRYGSAAAAAVVSLYIVVKILPALIAAMGIGVFLAIVFLPYWLPTIIAFKRNHPSKAAIAAVNFFFGWTFVGWIVSFVWALSNNGSGNQQTVVVNNNVTTNAASAPPAPTYQVGDVVNGHHFTGTAWVPVASAPPAPPLAPPVPTQAQPVQIEQQSRTTS